MMDFYEKNQADANTPDIPSDVFNSYVSIIDRIEFDEIQIEVDQQDDGPKDW